MDNNRFDKKAIDQIQAAIEQASGNEVFFAGLVEEGRIVEVRILARGNQLSVPAVTHNLKPGMMVLHNHPSGDLTPSGSDITVASHLAREGIGFAVIDNEARRCYVVVEPDVGRAEVPVRLSRLEQVLAANGLVAAAMDGFELRPQQLAMAGRVAEVLNEGGHALLEAGTGTGKSLAYLVPAVLWAVDNEKRVVVSTNTINLQEQLLCKDIPLLQRALDIAFKAVLVKGRGNYLCRRKFRELLQAGADLVDEAELDDLKSLLDWEQKSGDGSLADLNFSPRPELWEMVSSDGDTCLRVQCPLFRECFFHRARREALDAQVLVVNHHLLFADIALRGTGNESGLLPAYQAVVFDEAHNVEQVATTWFGARVTRLGLLRTIGRVYSQRGSRVRGLLPVVERRLQAQSDLEQELLQGLVDEIHQNLVPLVLNAVGSVNDFFSYVQSFAEAEGEKKIRLNKPGEAIWPARVQRGRQLLNCLSTLAEGLERYTNRLENLGPAAFEPLLAPVVELGATVRRLKSAEISLREIILGDSKDVVRWLETYRTRQGLSVSFHQAPLAVAPLLSQHVWQRIPATILTSATLSVAGSFHYVRQQLGLNDKYKVLEALYPSPFDYSIQAMVGVPQDMPTPEQPEFIAQLGPAVLASIEATKGRALVLFTSYSMLQQVYRYIEKNICQRGITVLCQGNAPRSQLLERFRLETGSVLLATASFWEGVDVVGDSLSNLIITRLPFSVPDDPVMEARLEKLRAEGQNPFYEYQLPQAVLRFKQGFGRLIRSRTDCGVVLVLDRRISARRYGEKFIQSLPDCKIVYDSLAAVLEYQRRFMQ